MNSYLLRRLTPFFIVSILIELTFMIWQMIGHSANVDFSFMAMVKTSGVLILTTAVSFLFVMLPYTLYLLLLPSKYQNGRFDKIITTFSFLLFVLSTLCEEAASQIFWEEFSSAFNFIAVDYIIFTKKVLLNLEQTYSIIWLLGSILSLSIIITLLAYRWLFTTISAPKFRMRLFQSVIYGFVCVLAYLNINMANIEISPNSFNNEIAKEGTYSLFRSLHKNEVDYNKFYITHDEKENLEILQKNFNGSNVTFIEPKKNINRQISSFRPEKRANVIVILMKNLNAKYMAPSYKEYVPNISKLTSQSIYFPNAYATGDRSVRAIEAITLSMPPLPGLSVLGSPDNKNLHSLGSIFKSKGYDNKWIYGGYGRMDNIDEYFAGNNFKVLDRTHWSKGDISFANIWGTSDEDLYRKILNEADISFAEDKPFLSVALTMSNHHPYTYPDGKIETPLNDTPRHKAMKYADFALGEFLKEAQTKPWFDNTLFVFMTDRASGNARTQSSTLEDYRIPLIIYGPKFVKSQKIETPISQLDVTPTLLGLLDFNYQSRFYGQDALKPSYQPRIFFGSWQKIGYAQNGVEIILNPGRSYGITPTNTSETLKEKYLNEAVAYYQQAADWNNNLKE